MNICHFINLSLSSSVSLSLILTLTVKHWQSPFISLCFIFKKEIGCVYFYACDNSSGLL